MSFMTIRYLKPCKMSEICVCVCVYMCVFLRKVHNVSRTALESEERARSGGTRQSPACSLRSRFPLQWFPLYLCKSICLFVPSSFCCCCFDILMLMESAEGLDLGSAALFLPLPAPPVGVTGASFSTTATAAAAAAVLGGRPRRLTVDASVSASGVAF